MANVRSRQTVASLETSDPTVNTDDTLGYKIGNMIVNTSSSKIFVCADNSTGAAVWIEMNEIQGVMKTEILTISTPGQTAFTLSETPANDDGFLLFLNGQLRSLVTDYTRSGTSLTWLDLDGLTLDTSDELKAVYDFDTAAFIAAWESVSGVTELITSTDRVKLSATGGMDFDGGHNVKGISNDDGSASTSATDLITAQGAKVFAQENFLIAAANPTLTNPISNVTGDDTELIIPWDTASLNLGSIYNNGTYKVTAPKTGLYHWEGRLGLSDIQSSMTECEISLSYYNGSLTVKNYLNRSNFGVIRWPTGILDISFTWSGVLSAGDQIWINLKMGGGLSTKVVDISAGSRSLVLFQGNSVTT